MLENFNFPSKNRLLNKEQFDAVFQKREKQYSHCFISYVAENTEGFPRVGVILSKKQIRLATQRNTIRRIVKESFRHAIRDLPNVDIVIIGLKNATQVSKKDFARRIAQQWEKYQGFA